MSAYHCSCGFAINDPDEFGDHLRIVFTPDDDIAGDGREHAELACDRARVAGIIPAMEFLPAHVCACGFASDDTAEFDDHFLISFIPPSGIGIDGDRHVPVNP